MILWPGSFSTGKTKLNGYYEELPYQEGKTLNYSSTEDINSKEEEPTFKREERKEDHIHGRSGRTPDTPRDTRYTLIG